MDGLQRVILFTSSSDLKQRVVRGNEKELPHTEVTLALIGTGLSLVDDMRGQEVAYIGIPQYAIHLLSSTRSMYSTAIEVVTYQFA